MIKVASDWSDYRIIATGDGQKLERWGDIVLLRPDPQVIWGASSDLERYKGLDAVYRRSNTGGGYWDFRRNIPTEFSISRRGLTFALKLMGFKHTGVFPEQAVNWDTMISLIREAARPINVINLFGYTGGATLACLSAGASVCLVDAAKAMVDRCRTNVALSGLSDRPVRYIVDDCFKFVARELKRGKRYDAIIMDPPSYGRGPAGEVWRCESDLYEFVRLCSGLLSENPLFVLINSYTTGLQPTVLSNVLRKALPEKLIKRATIQSYEVGLPTDEAGIYLPCGCSGLVTMR